MCKSAVHTGTSLAPRYACMHGWIARLAHACGPSELAWLARSKVGHRLAHVVAQRRRCTHGALCSITCMRTHMLLSVLCLCCACLRLHALAILVLVARSPAALSSTISATISPAPSPAASPFAHYQLS